MNYRREIDGLRALAVLPVILFHAGFEVFRGGFIGVDIFFVISGFLITSLILEDLAQGRFSIRRFYERRARRILPALFLVTLVSIPIAFRWMVPMQYESFAGSLMAVVLFVSNMFFWRESGYFAAEASEKPLLHTWSLGVEEQYYVFFPLMLMLLWRYGKNRAFYGVAAAAAVSLLLCEIISRYYINANFFLIPTRAWELFAGSLCAFAMRDGDGKKHEAFACAGLALVVVPLFTYSEQLRLPSIYSIAPVLGTVLMLRYATAGSAVARILSWRPVVGIGLISYSAYLWHQPIFAFARIRSDDLLGPTEMLALSALALVLAFASWKWVEQPFRHRSHPHYVRGRVALAAALLAAAIIFAVGLHGKLTHGRQQSWEKTAPQGQVKAYQMFLTKDDHIVHFYSVDDSGECKFRINTITEEFAKRLVGCRKKYGPGIAIIGDSHPINTYFVLKYHAQDYPFMVGISLTACRVHAPAANCYYDKLVTLLQSTPNLFKDIIYEQSATYLMGDGSGKHHIESLPLDAPVPDIKPYEENIDKVAEYLATLSRYARITWFGPRVEPQIREKVMIHKGCDYHYRFRPNQVETYKRVDAAIKERLRGTSIRYRSQIDMLQLDLTKELMTCEMLYFIDKTHYTMDGEKYFSERIRLKKILDY